MPVRERKKLNFQNILSLGCTFESHREKTQLQVGLVHCYSEQYSRLQMLAFLTLQKFFSLLFMSDHMYPCMVWPPTL